MKKIVSVLLLALFAVNCLHAQSSEVLTNATIIKMVKARLSDDIILDEISNAKVNFDVSPDAIKSLSEQNVSEKVIMAMKASAASRQSTIKTIPEAPPVALATLAETTAQSQPAATKETSEKPATEDSSSHRIENQALPAANIAITTLAAPSQQNAESAPAKTPEVVPQVTLITQEVKQADKTEAKPESNSSEKLIIDSKKTETGTVISINKPAGRITTVSYITPTKDLITFYNSEFAKLAGVIKDWDKKLHASSVKEMQSIEAINAIEKELFDKKNENAEPFSKEIIELKNSLTKSWEKHKGTKVEMANEGKSLVEDLKRISKETSNSIATKFKEVSKNINNSNPDPSVGINSQAMLVPEQKFNHLATDFFVPVTTMLVCYENEIITLQQTISTWNAKAINSFYQDSVLRTRLEPLQNELLQYLATPKQNQKLKKKDISALKKQIDIIEKDRKSLAKQMETDSGNLSEELNKISAETQVVVEQRFVDIIQDIEHSYQDKFNQ